MISGKFAAGPRMVCSSECLINLLVKLRSYLMLIAHPCKFQKKTSNGNCRGISICVYFIK